MADKVTAEFGGKSKYEVAVQMAHQILNAEKKGITRQELLQTVAECIHILEGGSPHSKI